MLIYRTHLKYVRKLRKVTSREEPITFIGHSHGGNVIIEAINDMMYLPEFDNIEINLITINTPVRNDYQLNTEAKKRVKHVKVCSINSEFYEVAFLYITFRSLFAFIRCKVSSLIGRVARYTPSSTYTLPSTKNRKSPRHN